MTADRMEFAAKSKAKRVLSRALNVRDDEWPRLLFLYGMALVALTGIGWGETIVVASYLQRAGVGFLPWAFVMSALVSIVSLFVYSGFVDRVPNDRLFIWILASSGAGIAVGLALLAANVAVTAYLLLYLILSVPLTDLYNVHWATYVSHFYDTRAAKRVVPVLSTSTRVAGIIAGATMPLITRRLPPAMIIGLWLVSLLGVALMIFLMPRVLKDPTGDALTGSPGTRSDVALPPATRSRSSYLRNLREGYSFVAGSPFLRSLALATLLTTMWLTLINYRSSQILLEQLQTTVAIANFTGVLSAAANLVALPIQLFLLSRLIGRRGLGNASLIYPAGGVVVSAGLLAVPGLLTAALGYVTRTTFRTTFRSPIDALLYNAVPLRMKGRSRAFIGGLLVPIGTVIGGLLLLTPLVHNAVWLGVLIALSAVGVLASALVVRKHYGRALISLLEQEDYLAILSEGTLPEGATDLAADPAMIAKLRERLMSSTSPEFTIFMARLISDASGDEAVPVLSEACRSSGDARVRAALIDLLSGEGVASGRYVEATRTLCVEYLADPDPAVRLSALGGLSRSAHEGLPTEPVLPLLGDADIEVRARAIALFLQSENPEARRLAAEALDALLAGEDAHTRAQGVRLLAAGWDDPATRCRRMIVYLRDPADEVRMEAVLAIEATVASAGSGQKGAGSVLLPVLQADMLPLLRDPVQRVRQAALSVLAQFRTREANATLLEALGDDSPEVRRLASDALASAGKPVISLVHPKLSSPDARMRKMAAVILGRVDPRQFAALVESHITSDLLSIYRNRGLAAALEPCQDVVSMAVLRNALLEQSCELRDGLFYLLSAVHPPAAVKVIEGSMQSEDERARANAAEALESMTSPRLAALMAPLFEPDAQAAAAVTSGDDSWDLAASAHNTPEQALRELLTNHEDAWLRSIAAYSVGEWAGTSLAGGNGCLPKSAGALLDLASRDSALEVRQAGETARRQWAGDLQTSQTPALAEAAVRGNTMLSVIEKIILMKEVPFFQGMTVDQLRVLAAVCEEQFFPEGGTLFSRGEPGGTLYVIVSGRVAIEQERRAGSSARLATLGAHAYCGEMNLFDGTPHPAAALALQDTQVLRLRREPLIALARQHPELALALINVLTQRLRDANDRVADLTRSKPKELHKLYDSLG